MRDHHDPPPKPQRVSDWRWRLAQGVERRWWRSYLRGRDVAAYSAWKRDYWREFLRQVGVHVRPTARVLDAGCGPAGVFVALPEAQVVALDPLLPSYCALPHFAPASYPSVSFVATPLERWSAVDRFDYVFCLNAINHVRDMTRALGVLAAALTDEGTAVISVDAHRYTPARSIFAAIPGDVLHPHQRTELEYKAAIEAAGLQIVGRHLIKRELLFDYVAFVCFRKNPSWI